MYVIFPTGVHYHYNISIDFDCDKALPIFLLISAQTKSLIGFGLGGPFDVPSNEWEKPHPSVFAVSTYIHQSIGQAVVSQPVILSVSQSMGT